MKKYMIFFLIFTWSAIACGQDYLYFNSFFNFEDTTRYNHILINHPDIWKIMKPEKEILFFPSNTPSYGKYGIITETNQYYSPNTNASFQFKLWGIGGAELTDISFWHKYDFNPNVDGGIIETSWDYGETWQNIVFDSIIQSRLHYELGEGIYSLSDTISSFENQPGFTGLNSAGNYVSILFWTPFDLLDDSVIDTLLIRFTFKSGSFESEHEGWLLDEFDFRMVRFNSIEETPKINILTIFPNPANDIINISLENDVVSLIRIFTLTGQIIMETNQTTFCIGEIKPGIYIVKVNEKYFKKLIIK
jgi:hypothetical protein